MRKKKILILTTSSLHNGPRMIREIDALCDRYDIVAVGLTPPHHDEIAFLHSDMISISLVERVFNKLYRTLTGKFFEGLLPLVEGKIHQLIASVEPDIIIAHNPQHLPYLFSFKRKKYKVVFNAHEYYPMEFDENVNWMKTWGVFFDSLYRRYLSKLDLLVNVCDSIADRCKEEYGCDSLVIPNAAAYHGGVKAREISGYPIRLIHHGGAIRERQIEIMIEAVGMLGEKFQMDLMLVPSDKEYYNELKKLVYKYSNIRLIPPVSFHEIVTFINHYDIGLYNLPPLSFNNKIALPNKLYEFIQARLCLVVSPSVEMAKIVNTYQLGMVTNDFTATSFYQTLNQLTPEVINAFKLNSDRVAAQLSAEQYQIIYANRIDNL